MVRRLCALLLLAGCDAAAPPEPPRINAPFVPTPMETVERMLHMAQPRPEDVLYDLGSGDGRIPITAVQRYGVRKAVGIDIDPALVRESNRNAQAAGVADRVRFQQGDVFKVDFSEATVVTIYLLQHLNIELRPRLLNELRPGTRIVSYEFHLGEWEPEQSFPDNRGPPLLVDTTDDDVPSVYAWIVPAKVEGVWQLAFTDTFRFPLHLTQKFQDVAGEVRAGRQTVPIRNARLAGERISFEMTYRDEGRDTLYRFDGRVSGAVMVGTVTTSDGASHSFRAVRAH